MLLDAIGIDLPRQSFRYEYMPVVVSTVGDGIDGNDSLWLAVVLPLKEQQLDA